MVLKNLPLSPLARVMGKEEREKLHSSIIFSSSLHDSKVREERFKDGEKGRGRKKC